MREATARAIWTDVADGPQTETWDQSKPIQKPVLQSHWNAEQFARDQIRHLVHQIFFAPGLQVRQVAFSAIDPQEDGATVCRMVGDELSVSTNSEVAVVGADRMIGRFGDADKSVDVPPRRQSGEAVHPRTNLWFMPANAGPQWHLGAGMRTHMQDIRREFEYSIVQAPSLVVSEEAWALAEWADGVVLVISAQHTRRAVAVKIREMLTAARVRVLGAVLTKREFPIPEKIYRQL